MTTLPYYKTPYTANRNDWNGQVGYSFTPRQSVTVTQLGRGLSPGYSSIRAASTVTVWQSSTGAALGSVTVGPSSGVTSSYAYEALPSAITLSAGTEYRISQMCTISMLDSWVDQYDGTITTSEAETGMITMGTGVYSSNTGYPLRNDGHHRRAGMLNFLFSVPMTTLPYYKT
eukprot:6374337-Prymnesium_polylepis.1